MDEREIVALLDVLEYDALAAFEDEDPGFYTWERPGLIWQLMPLHRVRNYIKTWKELMS